MVIFKSPRRNLLFTFEVIRLKCVLVWCKKKSAHSVLIVPVFHENFTIFFLLCIFLGHANFDDDISTDELYIQCESAYTKVNTRENVGGRRNLWPRTWRKGRVGSIIQGLSNIVMLFSFGERTQLGGWGAISKRE